MDDGNRLNNPQDGFRQHNTSVRSIDSLRPQKFLTRQQHEKFKEMRSQMSTQSPDSVMAPVIFGGKNPSQRVTLDGSPGWSASGNNYRVSVEESSAFSHFSERKTNSRTKARSKRSDGKSVSSDNDYSQSPGGCPGSSSSVRSLYSVDNAVLAAANALASGRNSGRNTPELQVGLKPVSSMSTLGDPFFTDNMKESVRALPCVPILDTSNVATDITQEAPGLQEEQDENVKPCFNLPFMQTPVNKKRKPNEFLNKVSSAFGTLIEPAMEYHLRRTRKSRIERTLSVLKGASFYYNDEEADAEINADVMLPTPSHSIPKLTRHHAVLGDKCACADKEGMANILNDMGISLFAPLNGAFKPQVPEPQDDDLNMYDWHPYIPRSHTRSIDQGDIYDSFEEEIPEVFVSVVREPEAVLKTSPRILGISAMEHIVEHGLPAIIQSRRWVRAYSLSRDGDSFGMFKSLVKFHRYSLIVVEATNGDLFGGFADSPWERQAGHGGRNFYGCGQSFLFRVNKLTNDDAEGDLIDPWTSSTEDVALYKWTGENNYCQMFDDDNGKLAMGGGGGPGCFGLCLEDNFMRGSTGYCKTYGNDPLTKDNEFNIVNVEVYGFWC